MRRITCSGCNVPLRGLEGAYRGRCAPCIVVRKKAQRNHLAKFKREYKKANPWTENLRHARSRCVDPKARSYPRYGGRGIVCLITLEEIKALWFRDGAGSMKKPSIDRIDSNGNYEFSNCRFIELNENASLGARGKSKCAVKHPGSPPQYFGGRCLRCRDSAISKITTSGGRDK